jgi:hypothetical protein
VRWEKRNGFREAELVIVPACSPTRFLHLAPVECANRHKGFACECVKGDEMGGHDGVRVLTRGI